MRAKEVREKLGISAVTLMKYCNEGKIKIKNKFSKRYFIYDDLSVEKFLKETLVLQEDVH